MLNNTLDFPPAYKHTASMCLCMCVWCLNMKNGQKDVYYPPTSAYVCVCVCMYKCI